MKCPECQHENPEDARFCNVCGKKLELTCRECGKANPLGSNFCNGWGEHQESIMMTGWWESFFDVALSIFSSLGYGSEAEDIAILSNLRAAVRSGGLVFIETTHRDRIVARLLRNPRPANRLPDGTLLVEEPSLDPIAGRVETTWYWSGPGGSGQKSSSIRAYTVTELIQIVEAAGLRIRSVNNGCSTEPFVSPGSAIGERLGLLAIRE